uniref:TF_AP-2 domain-containing protein n=1 Tax=Steinernema glaseri TaxID=37863 RepID=A0A1I7Z2J8_9BILA
MVLSQRSQLASAATTLAAIPHLSLHNYFFLRATTYNSNLHNGVRVKLGSKARNYALGACPTPLVDIALALESLSTQAKHRSVGITRIRATLCLERACHCLARRSCRDELLKGLGEGLGAWRGQPVGPSSGTFAILTSEPRSPWSSIFIAHINNIKTPHKHL